MVQIGIVEIFLLKDALNMVKRQKVQMMASKMESLDGWRWLVSKHSIEVNVLSAPGGPYSVTSQLKVHCGTFGTSSNNSHSIR